MEGAVAVAKRGNMPPRPLGNINIFKDFLSISLLFFAAPWRYSYIAAPGAFVPFIFCPPIAAKLRGWQNLLWPVNVIELSLTNY
jgi:hypothetical protein